MRNATASVQAGRFIGNPLSYNAGNALRILMNKGELIDAIAQKASITKKDADALLTAALEAITEAVTLVGFGTFELV